MTSNSKELKVLLTLVCLCLLGLLTRLVFLFPPSEARYPVRGVDVSHYQGTIDWPVLAAQNIRFAFIKATEGSSSADERFAENWEAARNTDLAVGAYHFFSFDSSGITQAENFIRHVEKETGMLPPVVDVEFYGNKENDPPKVTGVQTELQDFLNELEEYYGVTPVIYTTMKAYKLYIKDAFDSYPLWIRDVITEPGKELQWTFWQYTGWGKLKGYQGQEQYIDINVFKGDMQEFMNWQAEVSVR